MATCPAGFPAVEIHPQEQAKKYSTMSGFAATASSDSLNTPGQHLRPVVTHEQADFA
jgi:hypothetical protein